jgi:hypothetical protein
MIEHIAEIIVTLAAGIYELNEKHYVVSIGILIALIGQMILFYNTLIVIAAHKAHIKRNNENDERAFTIISYIIIPVFLSEDSKWWYYYLKGMAEYFKGNDKSASKNLEKHIEVGGSRISPEVYIFLIKSLLRTKEYKKADKVYNEFGQKMNNKEYEDIINNEAFISNYSSVETYFQEVKNKKG